MISIIIPTLNEQDFLPGLLESIKKQDFKDIEIIVADSNSSDKTLKIAQSYKVRMVEGGVPSVARNRGAEVAIGDYLLFLDADVSLPDGFLMNLIEKFEKDYIDVCIPALVPFDSEKQIYKTIFSIANTYFKLMEKIKPQGCGACILVTKRLHKRIGGFDETRMRSEDLDYINRAATIGRFRCYLDLGVNFSVRRFESEGITTSIQKYFRSGSRFFFTGKQDEKTEYTYGKFNRAVISAVKVQKDRSAKIVIKKLLVRFNQLTKKLKKQLK